MPATLARAQRIFDVLVELGGEVPYQKELIQAVAETHGYSHGSICRYVDAMAEQGYVDVERHGPRDWFKRIVALRRPGSS